MTRLPRHARTRGAVVAAAAMGALLASAARGGFVEATEQGVADALGRAVGGAVERGDVVWEPSRGVLVDAVWGRGVAFLAGVEAGPDGVTRRDVFRARVTVAPGGAPMRVAALHRRTATPMADEHDLLGRGDRLAWVTRGAGGEHGVTVLVASPTVSMAERLARLGTEAGLPSRDTVHAVLEAPQPTLRAELHDDALVLAVGSGSSGFAASVDPIARAARTSAREAVIAVVAEPPGALAPAWSWRGAAAAPRPPDDETVALLTDASFPPAGPSWSALAEGRVHIAGEVPPPSAVARASVGEGERRVVLHAFDMRQLDLRVVPGPAAPRALSGLPGTGALAQRDRERLVALARITPLRDGGARVAAREIAPLTPGTPAIASTSGGQARIGPLDPGAVEAAIEAPDVAPASPAAGHCLAGSALLVATSPRGSRAAITESLQPLGCGPIAWVADLDGAAVPWLAGPETSDQPQSVAVFLRHRAFPEGRGEEGWAPAAGRQPQPVFRPAVLETTREVLGTRVRVVALAGQRFSWMLRAGTGERSHRAGGAFPEALGELGGRAIASISLGIGERRRPNGLTIDGSTGHRYALRGAVLHADADGLSLVRSAESRGDPQADATELALTVEGGEATPASRRRGLLQERADLCLLEDGTAMIAIARFDSHEATAEALLRLGCTHAVALDRGVDAAASVVLATRSDPLPDLSPMTVLVALERVNEDP